MTKVIYQIGYEGEDISKKNPIDDYKSPMSARMLMGLLKYINDVAERPAETLHVNVDASKEVVHLFFNCHAESVKDALSKEMRSGYFEASFYQNLLDNLGIPDEIEADIKELLKHKLREHGNKIGPLNLIADTIEGYEKSGMKFMKG